MQFCIVREDHITECNRFNGCPSAGLIKFSAVGRSMISILYGAGGGGVLMVVLQVMVLQVMVLQAML